MAITQDPLGIDVSKSLAQLARLQAMLLKQSAVVDQLTATHVNFDQATKQVSMTFEALAKSGETLTGVLHKENNIWLEKITSIRMSTEALRANAVQAARVKQYATAGVIEGRLPAAFPTAATSTTAEIERVQRAILNVTKVVSESKYNLIDFNTVLASIRSGNITSLTVEQIKLRNAVVAVKTASEASGKSAQRAGEIAIKVAERQALALQKVADAAKLEHSRDVGARISGREVSQLFSVQAGSASEAGIERYRKKLAQLMIDMQKGRVSAIDFNRAMADIQSGKPLGMPLSPSVEMARQKILAVGNALKEVQSEGVSAATAISNSWSLVRKAMLAVFAADIIGRGVSFFQNAAGAAAKFQTDIALLQTLSQDSTATFDDWSESIIRVSSALGKPQADVAAAAYDSLSNQVIKTAADFDQFGLTTGRLAIATKSSMKDTQDAVAGVMNSFGMNINDTERVSRVLFKTIDLGKVQMNELANSMGRISPFAHSLGISLEEEAAFLSVLTRQGISSEVAMTEMGQVFNALTKPGPELIKMFRDLGYATAEEAIAAKGFSGVLKMVQTTTGGATAKISELYPELRGAKGVVGVLANELNEYNDSLAKIQGGQASFEKASEKVTGNIGQKFNEEMEKLKNFWLNTWETLVLKNVLLATDYMGGFSEAIKGAYKAAVLLGGPLVLVAGTLKALSVYQAAFAAAQAAGSTGVGASIWSLVLIHPYIAALAAVAASIYFITVSWNMANAAASAYFKETTNQQKIADVEELRTVTIGTDARYQVLSESIKNQEGLYIEWGAAVRKVVDGTIEHQKEKLKEVDTSLKGSADIWLGVLRNQIQDLESKQSKSLAIVAKASKDANSVHEEGTRGKYERSKGDIEAGSTLWGTIDSENEKKSAIMHDVVALSEKYIQQLQKESDIAAKAGDVDLVKKKMEDMKGILQELATKRIDVVNPEFPDRLMSVRAVANIEEEIDALQARYLKVNQQITQQELRKAEIARVQTMEKKKQLESAEAAFKALVDFDVLDKQGKVKKEYADKPEAALDQLRKLQENVMSSIDSSAPIASKVGMMANFREAREALMKDMEKKTTAVDAVMGSEKQLNSIVASFDTQRLAVMKLTAEINKQKEAVIDLDKSKIASKGSALTDVDSMKNNVFQQLDMLSDVKGVGAGNRNLVNTQLTSLKDTLKDLSTASIPTAINQVNELKNSLQLSRGGPGILSTIIDPASGATFEQMLDRIKTDIRSFGTDTAKQDVLKTQTEDWTTKLIEMENQLQLSSSYYKTLATSASDFGVAGVKASDSVKKSFESFLESGEKVKGLFDSLKGIDVGPTKPETGPGGLIPKVDDVIKAGPAAMNFTPKLEQLNNFGSKSQPASNITNIGEILVTVENADNPAQTTQDLYDQIRRDLRRGNTTFS
jgi:TP901 family phage tail tape measure protein